MTIPETITVTAIIKGREELSDQSYKLSLEIPAFQSEYPTVVYGCPVEDGDKLTPGTSHSVTLKRSDQAKAGKNAEKYYNWMWRWDSLPTPGTPPSVAAGATAPTNRAQVPADPARASIERQTSLKAAVEYLAAKTAAGEKVHAFHVVNAAQLFYNWLSEGIIPKGKVQKPVTTESAPEPREIRVLNAPPPNDPEEPDPADFLLDPPEEERQGGGAPF